jgi:hypothetical protein
LVTLWGDNGDHSHTVAVCDNYIFDSNACHALDFNQDSLNECIGCHYQRVWKGYYFHEREENPKTLG